MALWHLQYDSENGRFVVLAKAGKMAQTLGLTVNNTTHLTIDEGLYLIRRGWASVDGVDDLCRFAFNLLDKEYASPDSVNALNLLRVLGFILMSPKDDEHMDCAVDVHLPNSHFKRSAHSPAFGTLRFSSVDSSVMAAVDKHAGVQFLSFSDMGSDFFACAEWLDSMTPEAVEFASPDPFTFLKHDGLN